MTRSRDGNRLYEEVLALRDAYLHASGAIDYARRRKNFPSPTLLSVAEAEELASSLGVRLTHTARISLSFMLWELVTGGDALLTRPALALHGSSRHRFRRLRDAWQTDIPHPVLQAASELLSQKKIDEPVRQVWVRGSDGGWFAQVDDPSIERMARSSSQPPLVVQLPLAPPQVVAQYLNANAWVGGGSFIGRDLGRAFSVVAHFSDHPRFQEDVDRALEFVRTHTQQDVSARLCCIRTGTEMTLASHVVDLRGSNPARTRHDIEATTEIAGE